MSAPTAQEVAASLPPLSAEQVEKIAAALSLTKKAGTE